MARLTMAAAAAAEASHFPPCVCVRTRARPYAWATPYGAKLPQLPQLPQCFLIMECSILNLRNTRHIRNMILTCLSMPGVGASTRPHPNAQLARRLSTPSPSPSVCTSQLADPKEPRHDRCRAWRG
jgi:hypothetical protein